MPAYLKAVGLAALVAFAGLAAGVSGAAAGDARLGKQKAAMCRTCHGLDGIAKIPIAPHIAGENEIYLQTQLKAFRSGKRQNEIMSVIAGQLSDADIANLAAWYASIQITATMPAD
jgi:cytochrome c553